MKSLKIKIITVLIVCILAVGMLCGSILYYYLSGIIAKKNNHIDEIYINTAYNQLQESINQVEALFNICSVDLMAASTMELTQLETPQDKRLAGDTNDQLKAYLLANKMGQYINKLMIFNEEGLGIQVYTGYRNQINDPMRVMALPIFEAAKNDKNIMHSSVTKSISKEEDCLMLIGGLYNYVSGEYSGYVYIEVNIEFIEDILVAYDSGRVFVFAGDEKTIPLDASELTASILDAIDNGNNQLKYEKKIYDIRSKSLSVADLILVSYSDITFFTDDDSPVIFTAILTASMALVVIIVLSFILSNKITQPLKRLTERIRKIGNKDFSYDREIEIGHDEIAEAGKVVNEMCSNINQLLIESEQMHIQKRNDDIALLQSQINPHFLYNTLDSIKWMASIRKNAGIENITKSLINLLRNISKDVGGKISLEEEIVLLKDYCTIQSIRYMETFTLKNNITENFNKYRIVKFTLQPLIENAIFHGIEPKGNPGNIILDALEEENDILITIEDDGVGMDEESMIKILTTQKDEKDTMMTGVGVYNVNNRLKLIYGSKYGISFESEKGAYTRVTVRIPKELYDV